MSSFATRVSSLGLALCAALGAGAASAQSPFVRSDVNDDGFNDIADPVWIVNELVRGGPVATCSDAADANDDGMIDLSDASYIVSHQFLAGLPPPPPFPSCGEDPTTDALDCDTFTSCAGGTPPVVDPDFFLVGGGPKKISGNVGDTIAFRGGASFESLAPSGPVEGFEISMSVVGSAILEVTAAALPTNPDIQGMTVCPGGVAAGAVQSNSSVNDGPDGSVAAVVLEFMGTAEIAPISGCGTMLVNFNDPACAPAGDLLVINNQTVAATTTDASPTLVCNDGGAGEPFVLQEIASSSFLEVPVAAAKKILFMNFGEELVVIDTEPFPTDTNIIAKASDIANCTNFLGSYSISPDAEQVAALCNDSPNGRSTIQQIPAGGGTATQVLATASSPTGPFNEVLGVIADLQFAGAGSLAFRGGGFDGANFVDVAWLFSPGGPLTKTVARGDPVPGATTGVVIDLMGGVSADEEHVTVDALGSDGNSYVLSYGPLSGTPTTTQLAGPTGTFTTDFAGDGTACGDGYQMWFFSDASNSGWAGLAAGGTPEILIDESTLLPGGDMPLGFNTGAACDFDQASGAFEGLFNVTTVANPTDPLVVHLSGQTGGYGSAGGARAVGAVARSSAAEAIVTPIVNQSELVNDGFQAIFLFASDDGLDDSQASFIAFFGNGAQTNYVTQLPEPTSSALLVAGASLLALLQRIRCRR